MSERNLPLDLGATWSINVDSKLNCALFEIEGRHKVPQEGVAENKQPLVIIVIRDGNRTQVLLLVISAESVAFGCDGIVGVLELDGDVSHQRGVVVTGMLCRLAVDAGAVHLGGDLRDVFLELRVVGVAKVDKACTSVENGVPNP